jgi:hypothetical protein
MRILFILELIVLFLVSSAVVSLVEYISYTRGPAP